MKNSNTSVIVYGTLCEARENLGWPDYLAHNISSRIFACLGSGSLTRKLGRVEIWASIGNAKHIAPARRYAEVLLAEHDRLLDAERRA